MQHHVGRFQPAVTTYAATPAVGSSNRGSSRLQHQLVQSSMPPPTTHVVDAARRKPRLRLQDRLPPLQPTVLSSRLAIVVVTDGRKSAPVSSQIWTQYEREREEEGEEEGRRGRREQACSMRRPYRRRLGLAALRCHPLGARRREHEIRKVEENGRRCGPASAAMDVALQSRMQLRRRQVPTCDRRGCNICGR